MGYRLIPCHLPFIGLVRIGNQPGLAIGHTLWREGKGIGPVHFGIPPDWRHWRSALFGLRLAFGERTDCAIKAIEKWRTQNKASDDVLSRDRKQFRQAHFARMLRHIMIEASGIGFGHCAYLRRQFHVALFGGFARPQQVHDVIDLRPVRASQRPITAACHRHDIFYRRKIIFGVRIGKAISGVRIRRAVDMRHTIFVAHNLGIIGPLGGFIFSRCQWLPQGACTCNHTDKRQRRPQKFTHHSLPHNETLSHRSICVHIRHNQDLRKGKSLYVSQLLSPCTGKHSNHPRICAGRCHWIGRSTINSRAFAATTH